MSNALYTATELRAVEHAALASLPSFTMMQRAGDAAAAFALEILGPGTEPRHVLVLAGPGNNGGDALQAAAGIADAGAVVTVVLFAEPDRQSEDSRLALDNAKASGVRFVPAADFGAALLTSPWSLVIDGLFGIGLARAIGEPLHGVIASINALDCPVLALDVPSGLDTDTGTIVDNLGNDCGIAVRATHTITFIGDKPGLHTCEGRDYAGSVLVANLDVDTKLFPPARAQLNAPLLFDRWLVSRPHNSHKGTYGDVTIVGGAHGMCGAAVLAARAAAKSGAGRVFAAFLGEPPAYDSAQPELMCRRADAMALDNGTLVLGPGLGTSAAAHALVSQAIRLDLPLVLDADALNLIAGDPRLQSDLAARNQPALMTPHPLEAARLLGVAAAQVQSDRPAAARMLASRFNVVVILKGSGSVIAQPSGAIAINPTGNPALATAGTGDVLAGVCGALLAQSWPAWPAALAASWMHGHAADVLESHGTGPIGLVAGELIPCIRSILNRLTGTTAEQRSAGKRA